MNESREEIFNSLKEKVKIYIPTYKRELQLTYESLCDELKEITYFVVSNSDMKVLKKKYPNANYLFCEEQENSKGIGKVREWIIKNSSSKYIIMFDDNMNFYKRVSENDWHLKYTNDDIFDGNQTLQMVRYMLDLAEKDEHFAVALSCRQGNNNELSDFVEVGRMFAAFLINRDMFQKEKIEFGKVQIMEDFYITLDFLTRGYKNVIIYKYCFGKPSANMSGGCSSYRNFESQKDACLTLKERFPEFVKVVTKETKNWGEELNYRYDVRIQWRKAYDSFSKMKNKSLF